MPLHTDQILKIFIAGSKVLEKQRITLRAVLMRMQVLFNLMIEAKTFEDFSDSLIEGGRQTDYNRYITEQTDIAVFVFDNSVGGITKDEFNLAYKNYTEHKRPHIYVYCRKSDIESEDIRSFKAYLNELNQYYTEYKDNEDLSHSFEKSITEYLVNTYFLTKKRSAKEQSMFDLACQNLSNTMLSCLSVVDEFGCIIAEISSSWNKYLSDSKQVSFPEEKIDAVTNLLENLSHYLSEIKRIASIYPPEKISIKNEDIEILTTQVKKISEITYLPTLYQTYFNDVIKPFDAIDKYLTSDNSKSINAKMVNLQIKIFQFLANGFFYTIIQYISQLPEPYKKNAKEMQLLWNTYPRNVSLNLSIDEYERFSKREFDDAERLIIEMQGVLAAEDEELERLKSQIDKIANYKNQSIFSKLYLRIRQSFCPHKKQHS